MIKDKSVNLHGLQVQMQPALKEGNRIWKEVLGLKLLITSARDGIHSPGSLHYYGYAVDFRTWDKKGRQVDDATRKKLVDSLRTILTAYSPYYDVITHTTHIHVEWDAFKAGAVF